MPLRRARVVRPIDVGLLAAAAQRAADEAETHDDPAKAIEAATNAFYEAVAGAMPSVFVLEHGRLWLIAQRGYAVVPDGITVESGITGRAVRLSRAQLATDVHADPDYVQALPGVVSELAIPLRAGRVVDRNPQHRVGASAPRRRRRGPPSARPSARRRWPERSARTERSTCRGSLGSSSISGAFELRPTSQRSPRRRCRVSSRSRRRRSSSGAISGRRPSLRRGRRRLRTRPPLSADEIEAARAQTDPSVVCQVLRAASATERPSSGFRCARTPASSARWSG